MFVTFVSAFSQTKLTLLVHIHCFQLYNTWSIRHIITTSPCAIPVADSFPSVTFLVFFLLFVGHSNPIAIASLLLPSLVLQDWLRRTCLVTTPSPSPSPSPPSSLDPASQEVKARIALPSYWIYKWHTPDRAGIPPPAWLQGHRQVTRTILAPCAVTHHLGAVPID